MIIHHQIIHYDVEKIFQDEYLIMITIGEKIRDEKLQCKINREAAKI